MEEEVTEPTLLSLIPSSDPLNLRQRADVLSIKGRLAALLPPEQGQEYWIALVEFMTGRINRQELGVVMRRVLGTRGEAGALSTPSHSSVVL